MAEAALRDREGQLDQALKRIAELEAALASRTASLPPSVGVNASTPVASSSSGLRLAITPKGENAIHLDIRRA